MGRTEAQKFTNCPKDRDKLQEENSRIFEEAQVKQSNISNIHPYLYGFDRSMLKNGFVLEDGVDFESLEGPFKRRFLQLADNKILFLLMRTNKRIYEECFTIYGLRVFWLYIMDYENPVVRKCRLKENGEVDLVVPVEHIGEYNFEKLLVSQHVIYFGRRDSNHKMIVDKLSKLERTFKEFRYMIYVGEIEKLMDLIHPAVCLLDISLVLNMVDDIDYILNSILHVEYIVIYLVYPSGQLDTEEVTQKLVKWMSMRKTAPKSFIFWYRDIEQGRFVYIDGSRFRTFTHTLDGQFDDESIDEYFTVGHVV